MQRFFLFLKKNVDLDAAILLAAASCFIEGINPLNTLKELNFEILFLLSCLMMVVAGFRKDGLLSIILNRSLQFTDNIRSLSRMFIFVTFFMSMLITNDVALIIFVPLTISAFMALNFKHLLVPVLSLQTIAANMGSMLTPIGNPQNLYIFTQFDYDLMHFLSVTFPVVCICALILFVMTAFIGKDEVTYVRDQNKTLSVKKLMPLNLAFVACILCVLRVIPIEYVTLFSCFMVLLTDKKLFLEIDFKLIALFFFLFILVGNIASSEAVSALAHEFVGGYEYFVGLTLSQIISNVPAAVLLSNFAVDTDQLLLGVDVGGLGTIIASMASLITFKFYIRMVGDKPLRYLRKFTKYNIMFLLFLLPLHLFFSYWF